MKNETLGAEDKTQKRKVKNECRVLKRKKRRFS